MNSIYSPSGVPASNNHMAEREFVVRRPFLLRRIFPPFTCFFLSARRPALSLPEALIALLILSVALVALAAVPLMATKLALSSVERRQAVSLAVRGLDWLESLGAEQLLVSEDVAHGRFRVDYFKPSAEVADGEAVVTVRWSGPARLSTLVLTRPLTPLPDIPRPRPFGGAPP